ncbi:unnamed protein product [Sympodiomycopsis kandeliae]
MIPTAAVFLAVALAYCHEAAAAAIYNSSAVNQLHSRALGRTAIIGDCGVSAQHMFVGTDDKVYILDRSENNPLKLPNTDQSAISAEWSLGSKQCRPMAVATNQFCAGGGVLGDGSWGNLGGNPAQNNQPQGDGLLAIRHMKPCDDNSCNWAEDDNLKLQVPRWYPSVETAADGSLLAFGGYDKQVFLPYPKEGNTATVESYPTRGGLKNVPILDRSWPFSMYPVTSLLSDGRVFMVAGSETAVYNVDTTQEQELPQMPHGPRTYPGGGASVLLPLRPDNDYTETMMLCGGTVLPNWGDAGCPPPDAYAVPAGQECDAISPLRDAQWKSMASLPAPRVMGNFVILPTGAILLVNGAQAGVQGFGCGPGESQASKPMLTPHLYDPVANTWQALADVQVPRGYHSSATLLPDGSVLVAGSSPHPDVSNLQPFPTEYKLEVIYPPYYDSERPRNGQLPRQYPYGGKDFSIEFENAQQAQNAFVRLVRTGWSTHGLQMGQRSLELRRTVEDRKVTFHGLEQNPNLFPPGSALAFLVVNGIPSQGAMSVVGDGKAPQGL